ncbi:hypothetical protein BGW80DRAFT_349279 [Lactifluus volemus]|nr:hypothetical protein BGW80DRAFT_349279 [Lactifluus volemus]
MSRIENRKRLSKRRRRNEARNDRGHLTARVSCDYCDDTTYISAEVALMSRIENRKRLSKTKQKRRKRTEIEKGAEQSRAKGDPSPRRADLRRDSETHTTSRRRYGPTHVIAATRQREVGFTAEMKGEGKKKRREGRSCNYKPRLAIDDEVHSGREVRALRTSVGGSSLLGLASTLPTTCSGETPPAAQHGTQSMHGQLGRIILRIVARHVIVVHPATSVEIGDVQHLAMARPWEVHVGPRVPRTRPVNDNLRKIQSRLILAPGTICSLCALRRRKPETVAGLLVRRCHCGNENVPIRKGRRSGTLLSERSRSIPRLYFLSGRRFFSRGRIVGDCDGSVFTLSCWCFLSGDRGRFCPRRIDEDCDGRSRLAHGQRTRGSLRWRQQSAGAIRHCSEQSS